MDVRLNIDFYEKRLSGGCRGDVDSRWNVTKAKKNSPPPPLCPPTLHPGGFPLSRLEKTRARFLPAILSPWTSCQSNVNPNVYRVDETDEADDVLSRFLPRSLSLSLLLGFFIFRSRALEEITWPGIEKRKRERQEEKSHVLDLPFFPFSPALSSAFLYFPSTLLLFRTKLHGSAPTFSSSCFIPLESFLASKTCSANILFYFADSDDRAILKIKPFPLLFSILPYSHSVDLALFIIFPLDQPPPLSRDSKSLSTSRRLVQNTERKLDWGKPIVALENRCKRGSAREMKFVTEKFLYLFVFSELEISSGISLSEEIHFRFRVLV